MHIAGKRGNGEGTRVETQHGIVVWVFYETVPGKRIFGLVETCNVGVEERFCTCGIVG